MGPTKNTNSKEITANRLKTIDRILNALKARKLAIQAQQAQLDANTTEALCYEDVKERMSKAYQRNKRQKKIDKLQQIKSHWLGLS
jgi:Mn-dependent DtxR family transcriptional regulator